jgi:hypothetical protein
VPSSPPAFAVDRVEFSRPAWLADALAQRRPMLPAPRPKPCPNPRRVDDVRILAAPDGRPIVQCCADSECTYFAAAERSWLPIDTPEQQTEAWGPIQTREQALGRAAILQAGALLDSGPYPALSDRGPYRIETVVAPNVARLDSGAFAVQLPISLDGECRVPVQLATLRLEASGGLSEMHRKTLVDPKSPARASD